MHLRLLTWTDAGATCPGYDRVRSRSCPVIGRETTPRPTRTTCCVVLCCVVKVNGRLADHVASITTSDAPSRENQLRRCYVRLNARRASRTMLACHGLTASMDGDALYGGIKLLCARLKLGGKCHMRINYEYLSPLQEKTATKRHRIAHSYNMERVDIPRHNYNTREEPKVSGAIPPPTNRIVAPEVSLLLVECSSQKTSFHPTQRIRSCLPKSPSNRLTFAQIQGPCSCVGLLVWMCDG